MRVSGNKRAYLDGVAFGKSIRSIVHLMYQCRTAVGFITGVKKVVDEIYEERLVAHKEMLAHERQLRRAKKSK